MASVKNVMQKEIFLPNDEKLLAVISVTKPTGRKKKPSFLALSVVHHRDRAILSRIKTVDKKESLGTYKRVKTWSLSDLKMVDCHGEAAELDFKFEKQTFKWIVINSVEKRLFVVNLFKAIHKYYDRTNTKFINVDEVKLQDLVESSSNAEARTASIDDVEEILEQEEYRELNPQEEADLENLLKSGGRENAIQDATAFMENLTEELSQLDQSNIHSLMGSEQQIEQLMEYLEGGIMEVEKMETHLNVYDELLAGVRGTMQKLSFQYCHILRQNANLKSLCDEVDGIVMKLDLDPRVEIVLQECPLGTRSNIQDCVTAAQTLQKAINQEQSPGVSILQAVRDQKEYFSRLSSAFGRRLQENLTSQFVHNASTMTENSHLRHTNPSLASHSLVHDGLLMYQDLTKWLKDCQPEFFSEVMDSYIRAFRHVYEEQIRGLLKENRDILQLVRNLESKKSGGFVMNKISGSTVDIRSPLSGSLSSLSPARGGSSLMSQSVADFGASPSITSLQDSSRAPTFDRLFPLVLEQVQPVCVAEQKFLNSFFHFGRSEGIAEQFDEVEDERDFVDSFRGVQSSDTRIITSSGAQHFLNQLFAALLPELEEFIVFGERLDSYNALYLLVYVSQRLIFAEESGGTLSYLDETLKKALIHIRRLFDKFIAEKNKQIQDTKVPRATKVGILPCVKVFEEFAERSERIVMATDRRTELDKAYQFLMDTLFKTVERVALEHPKAPNVIKFENYNKIVDILARLKIVCLEKSKDEARKKYRSHKNDYVNHCLGRPMDKLSAFFEGIENLRASGTKAEEVGFRLEYSKTELKKCIKEYPGREVKRGLEKLYRRVEKEVSEGPLQVVWGNMQSAFIQQCVKFQELIEECYPGSNIALDFSVADLTDYFSIISRSAK